MNPNGKYRYGVGSMSNNRNSINPNNQQLPPHAIAPMPVAHHNLNNFEMDFNGAYSRLDGQPGSESSRYYSHPATGTSLPQGQSSYTSDDSEYQLASNHLSPRGASGQSVPPQNLNPDPYNDLLFQGSNPHLILDDDILNQAMDLPDNFPDDIFSHPFSTGQGPLDPSTGPSRQMFEVPSQHNGSQCADQRLLQTLAHHLRCCHSAISGGTLSPGGLAPVWPQVEQHVTHINSLITSLRPSASIFSSSQESQAMPLADSEPRPAGEINDVHEGDPQVNGKKFRCRMLNCPSKTKVFTLYSTFQRHIETQHFPRYTFYCPINPSTCPKVNRRDKMVDHCRRAHLQAAADIDENKVDIPCQANCPFCSTVARSWSEFYKCFIKHCIIEDDSADDHQPTSHHNGPGNGGAGPSRGNGRRAPASEPGGSKRVKLNDSLGGSTGGAQGYGSHFSQYTLNQLDSNQSTAMDNRSLSNGAGLLAPPQPYPPSDITEQRRQSTGQIPPNALPRGQVFRVPPRHQPTQPEVIPQQQVQCQNCPHNLSDCNEECTLLIRTDGCHACNAGRAYIQANMASLTQALASSQRPSLAGRRGLQSRSFGYLMPERNSFEHGVHQSHRPQRHRGHTNRGGGPRRRGGGPGVMMVTRVPDPVLGEYEELKPSRLLATKDEPTAIWLPFRGLPRSVAKLLPAESSEVHEETPSIKVDPADLSPSTLTLVRPTPLFECRCSCVVKAKGISYSQQTQLIPGKILDVNMRFLPEERAGHPLRTRIRVVVKLLKLQSSVTTRPGAKEKSKEDGKAIESALKTNLDEPTLALRPARYLGWNDEERGDPDESENSDMENDGIFSDAESEISAASEEMSRPETPELSVKSYKKFTSPEDMDLLFLDDTDDASSDLDGTLIGSDDEVDASSINDSRLMNREDAVSRNDIEQSEFEFQMEFDAGAYLRRLSTWTNVLSDVDPRELSNGNVNDPELVLQHFLRFLLHVMFALGRSRYYSSPSLLE